MKSTIAFLLCLILPVSLAFSEDHEPSIYSNSPEMWQNYGAHLDENRLSGLGTVTVLVNESNREQMLFYWAQKLSILAKSKSQTYFKQNQKQTARLKEFVKMAEYGEEFIYEKQYEITPNNFMEKLRQLIISGVAGVQFSYDSGRGLAEDSLVLSLDLAIEQGWFKGCEDLLFNGRSFQR